MIFLFQVLLRHELLFPRSFQRSRDQSVFWFNRLVLTRRPFRLVSCSLSPMLPQLIQFGPLLLQPFSGQERQFERGWLQRCQRLLTHKAIKARTCQVLASRFPVVIVPLDTLIGVKVIPTIVVMDRHATRTASTHHETSKQSRSTARCSHGIGTSTIGLQPLLVPLILLSRNVGWTAVGQQHKPVFLRDHDSSCARVLQLFPTGIVLAPPVDVEPRIQGMFEHHLESGPIGAVPD